ncbi:DUF1631 family protein [Sinimarinibacterium sp. NLF-5-8]|uniref:DUF1631 family protein n=1 Tax=Sinimarinibacterium sp. NLF-5-8 TaxID=2698684 RepID=UPI00137BE415|nr:DUF1631 family protein [Sinimarinibacterium sp. NLF-5-8]QHS09674.1 DUF1631 domain-containing protein [Sinimarinibacterium sp. NLF-5-8]
MTQPFAPADVTDADADPQSPQTANPIVRALFEMAVTVLGEQLREMFDKADDILFDSAEKARAGDEQRVYLDTMRIVRVQRARIIRAFVEALRKALAGVGEDADQTRAPDSSDIGQWTLQDGDALEERIAVSNMEAKASALHAHELMDLQRRLAQLAGVPGHEVSPEAMAPQRIIRAFQASMQQLNVDFPIKLVIYKLFDRVVVSRLSEVFVGANQLLAQHGIEPGPAPAFVSAPSARAASSAGAEAGAVPEWARGLDAGAVFAPHPAVVPDGLAAIASGARGYGDQALAHDIAHILSAYGQGQAPQPPQWLPAENVALVARMFDDYFRDPRLTDAFKPLFARLQWPVMKAALADPRFFAAAEHPARRAVHDVFDMLLRFGSAEALPSAQLVGELQGLIEAVVRRFDLNPEAVRAQAGTALAPQVADAFLHEQVDQQQKKNHNRIERVRRVVAHELRCRIANRPLPVDVMRLMLSGFGPLLCLDYLRSGIEGAAWTQTMQWVDRVLDSLEPDMTASAAGRIDPSEIIANLTRMLGRVGFSEARIDQLLAGLLRIYRDDGSAPSAPVDTLPQPVSIEAELQGLLSVLLVPGAWFTLWEPSTQTKHWLRLRSYYPAQNGVLFAHYMEPRVLSLRGSTFATELVEGRALPIDPEPEVQVAVARLLKLPFARETAAWAWVADSGRVADQPR